MNGRRILLAASVAVLTACSQSEAPVEQGAAAAGFPITVQNCGRDVVIDAPPQRAVSLNQGSTEILLSLGLADRMVGTATWTDPVRENLAEDNATVPQLAVNKPSLETVLDAEPDFVSASFAGTLGPGGVADRDQFDSLGVPTYLAPSDCVGKVSVNADGARTEPFTMDAIYGEIRDLARIFDVTERGEELIAGLQRRMQDSRLRADADLAYWFSDIRAPYFGGCCGSPGVITDTVGARNIFVDTTEEWPQVSWEVIGERDPDVLVLADLSRRTIDGDALAAKIEFLESNPVTSRLTAVREKRYIVVNGADLNPSIRTVDGTEKVADGLRRLGFAPRPLTVRTRSLPVLWVLGLALLVVSAAVAITIGPAALSVRDVYGIVAEHLGAGPSGATRIQDGIVWQLRLPRVLLAAVCGAGLALCGAILQSLLRNPLADPFVLGVSSGASTGAVLIAVLGVGAGTLTLSGGAFVGAVLSFGVVLLLAHAAGGGTDRVVLAGVAATQLFSALTSFIVLSSADAEQTRGVLFWLLGSLAGVSWNDVAVCSVVVGAGLVCCLAYARALDAFAFGDDAAATLGVSVRQARIVLLVMTALITASLVSAAGAIGFVGLVLPHAARFVVGPAHLRLLPTVAIFGAVFMVWVDTLARTVFAPQELPTGVVTALLGVPAFALILLRRRGDTVVTLHADQVGWTRSGRLVLDGVTVEPAPGATVGLLGPNGSGKSSLLKLLAGVDRPSRGTVHLDDEPVARMPRRALARRVAMVAQHAETELHVTVRDVVRLGRIPYTGMIGADPDGARVVDAALAATGLVDMTDRYWHMLSGGERQRVQIARALAQDPDHLLLDEPTNHLDIAHQLEILALVRQLNVTTVVALHDLNLAAMFCDHVVVLSAGRIVATGAPVQVLTEPLIAAVYGVRCRVSIEDGLPHVRFAHR